LISEDLELDLWVSADGGTSLPLDEDEFAAIDPTETERGMARRARRALAELEELARSRFANAGLEAGDPTSRSGLGN
jgi:hypothetical protein